MIRSSPGGTKSPTRDSMKRSPVTRPLLVNDYWVYEPTHQRARQVNKPAANVLVAAEAQRRVSGKAAVAVCNDRRQSSRGRVTRAISSAIRLDAKRC